MRVPNDLNFDTETYLLFSIYYESYWGRSVWKGTAATYLETFAKEIESTGNVLQWLGLASPDEESPLGSKPSHELVRLIVKPRKSFRRSRQSCVFAPDEEAISMILDAALCNVDDLPCKVIEYVQSVLGFLGLLNFTDDGDWIPTRRLLELATESRWQKGYRLERQRCAKLELAASLDM